MLAAPTASFSELIRDTGRTNLLLSEKGDNLHCSQLGRYHLDPEVVEAL